MRKNLFFVEAYKFYCLIIITIFLIVILPFLNISFFKNDNKIFYGSYLEKEKTFKNMLSQYEVSLKALQANKLFNNFVINSTNKDEVLELFLFTKKSSLDITQIRYLNAFGNELLRVEGDAISVFHNEAESFITKDSMLQNKSDSDYFKKFINAKPLEVIYSDITLNKEHGKVTIPKEPTLRMAIKVYGNTTKLQGLLIYNISLRSFFFDMYNHFIHKLYIVDSEGKFIFHNNPEYGLLGNNHSVTIKEEFPKEYKNILNKDEYHSSEIHSYSLKSLSQVKKTILILKDKD